VVRAMNAYWDEVAEEVERRVMAELDTIYRPHQGHQTAAWKKHIVEVLSEKSKLLRRVGANQRRVRVKD
jgi:hypothetical protein